MPIKADDGRHGQRGITWDKANGKWVARGRYSTKQETIGRYATYEEAQVAYMQYMIDGTRQTKRDTTKHVYTCTCGGANTNGTCESCYNDYRRVLRGGKPKPPKQMIDCEICGVKLTQHLRCDGCTILIGHKHASKTPVYTTVNVIRKEELRIIPTVLCASCHRGRLYRAQHKLEHIGGLNAWSEIPDGIKSSGLIVRANGKVRQ